VALLCDFDVFFFSSRRRHTRWPRDWSSDVCSSDLWENSTDPARFNEVEENIAFRLNFPRGLVLQATAGYGAAQASFLQVCGEKRSEERRVGKECRCWWRR